MNEQAQITIFSIPGRITMWSDNQNFTCSEDEQADLMKISGVERINTSRDDHGLTIEIFHEKTKRKDVFTQVKVWAKKQGRVVVSQI